MRLSPSLLLIIFALASAADLQLRGLPGTDVEQLTDPTTAVPSTARTEPGLREYKFGEYKPSDAPKVACIKFESINMVGDTVFVGSDGSGPPTVGKPYSCRFIQMRIALLLKNPNSFQNLFSY
jgi:hypothetical protein